MASAIALCGTFIAKADFINYGIGFDGGASFGGAKFKEKKDSKELTGDMTYNWNPSLYFGMDFGDEGDEVIGFEIAGGFGGRKLALKPMALTAEEKKGLSDEEKKKLEKSPYEMGLMGATFSVVGKGMFARFDGGCMVIKFGIDGYYAFIKNCKNFGVALTGDNKKAAEKQVKELNLAGKFVLGAELFDEVISVGLGGRYFFLEQDNSTTAEKDAMKKVGGSASLGAGQIDANLFVQFNIAKFIA